VPKPIVGCACSEPIAPPSLGMSNIPSGAPNFACTRASRTATDNLRHLLASRGNSKMLSRIVAEKALPSLAVAGCRTTGKNGRAQFDRIKTKPHPARLRNTYQGARQRRSPCRSRPPGIHRPFPLVAVRTRCPVGSICETSPARGCVWKQMNDNCALSAPEFTVSSVRA